MLSIGVVKAEVDFKHNLLGGVSLDRTRLVITNGETSGSIGVNNKNPTSMVVTSWVVDLEGKVSDSFVVSPSIFQLGAYKTGKTSIRLVDRLPSDRESVFLLKVNTAQAGESNKNSLKVAIGQKIKVFYRPKGLAGDANYAARNLIWSFDKNIVRVDNPTALSVSVSDLILDGNTDRIADMVLPFSSKSWKIDDVKSNALQKSFTFVDEYGGFKEIPIKPKAD